MLDLHPIVVFAISLVAGMVVFVLGVVVGRGTREGEVERLAHERAEAVNDAINWRQRCGEMRESSVARGRALIAALAARPGVARLAAIGIECDHALSEPSKDAARMEIELLRPEQEEEFTTEAQRAQREPEDVAPSAAGKAGA